MREVRVTALLTLSLAACGGNVVVDASASGAGGARGTSSSATSASSSSAASTSSGAVCGGCSEMACPSSPPAAGDSCQCCAQACSYGLCRGDGSVTTATCTTTGWAIESTSCMGGPLCGATPCAPGLVCLHHIGGPLTPTPDQCIPSPCGSSPLDCACATSVCPTDPGDTCAVKGGALVCGCPLCK